MIASLINGEPGSSVAVSDRGLHYGDGLFETISCIGGRPRWLEWHLERLQRGVERLRLPFDAFETLRTEVTSTAVAHGRCLIKILVTRGTGSRRGYRPSGDEVATRIVACYEWPDAQPAQGSFDVGRSDVPLGSNPLLAGLKHLNRLEQVLAQQRSAASGWHEVLMFGATGQLISGSMSNVFIVQGQQLVTPDLRDCGVEGVMRRVVMQAAAQGRLSVQVRPVMPEELPGISEMFVTNVRLGAQSVTRYDGRVLPSDQMARWLQGRIDAAYP
jgi:4-amino-4-deoxychorismate lyase